MIAFVSVALLVDARTQLINMHGENYEENLEVREQKTLKNEVRSALESYRTGKKLELNGYNILNKNKHYYKQCPMKDYRKPHGCYYKKYFKRYHSPYYRPFYEHHYRPHNKGHYKYRGRTLMTMVI